MTRNMPISPGAPVLWKPDDDATLCGMVALDQYSFTEIARVMRKTKGSVIGRFYRIAARMEGRVQG